MSTHPDAQPSGPFFRIAFLSKLAVAMTETDMDRLLTRAWASNTHRGITGVLILERGMFFQVLEGTEDATRQLFQLISSDPRHRQVQLLMDEPANDRFFEDWSMAFCQLQEPELKSAFTAVEEAAASPNPREGACAPIRELMDHLHAHLEKGNHATTS